MNNISIQIKTYFCAMLIVFFPLCATEKQPVESVQQKVKKNNLVIWYKKRSTHIVAATTIAAVIVLYAIVVHHNKILDPLALCGALFGAQKSMDKNDTDKTNNNINKINQPVGVVENTISLNDNKGTEDKNKKEEVVRHDGMPQEKYQGKTGIFNNMIQKVFGKDETASSSLGLSGSESSNVDKLGYDRDNLPYY